MVRRFGDIIFKPPVASVAGRSKVVVHMMLNNCLLLMSLFIVILFLVFVFMQYLVFFVVLKSSS